MDSREVKHIFSHSFFNYYITFRNPTNWSWNPPNVNLRESDGNFSRKFSIISLRNFYCSFLKNSLEKFISSSELFQQFLQGFSRKKEINPGIAPKIATIIPTEVFWGNAQRNPPETPPDITPEIPPRIPPEIHPKISPKVPWEISPLRIPPAFLQQFIHGFFY